MGFIKPTTYKGFSPRYWSITSLRDDKLTNTTEVTVSLFKDRATRMAEPSATITTLVFTLPGIDLRRAEIYPLLKMIPHNEAKQGDPPFFEDATDDDDK